MSLYKPELFTDREQAIPHSSAHADGGTLARLRERMERIEQGRTPASGRMPDLATGFPAIDHALFRDSNPIPDSMDTTLTGGLVGGAVHELAGQAAEALLLRLLARLTARDRRPVLWISARASEALLHGPGLAQTGIPTDRLILVRIRRPAEGLWAMEEALRSDAVAAVVSEPIQPLSLTASRRLQLAAETGGGFGFLLHSTGTGITPPIDQAAPSALTSRWRVDPTASEIGDDGSVTRQLDIALVRQRGGDGGAWRVAVD